jgi:hypothetical protein
MIIFQYFKIINFRFVEMDAIIHLATKLNLLKLQKKYHLLNLNYQLQQLKQKGLR